MLLRNVSGTPPDGAVSLLGDDEFRLALDLLLLLIVVRVVFFPPEKADEICILLDRAGLAQIAQARPALAIARASLRVAIELSENHDRDAQLLCQGLDAGRDFRDFHLTVIESAAAR